MPVPTTPITLGAGSLGTRDDGAALADALLASDVRDRHLEHLRRGRSETRARCRDRARRRPARRQAHLLEGRPLARRPADLRRRAHPPLARGVARAPRPRPPADLPPARPVHRDVRAGDGARTAPCRHSSRCASRASSTRSASRREPWPGARVRRDRPVRRRALAQPLHPRRPDGAADLRARPLARHDRLQRRTVRRRHARQRHRQLRLPRAARGLRGARRPRARHRGGVRRTARRGRAALLARQRPRRHHRRRHPDARSPGRAGGPARAPTCPPSSSPPSTPSARRPRRATTRSTAAVLGPPEVLRLEPEPCACLVDRHEASRTRRAAS